MRADDIRHGSHAGAVAHQRDGEAPCETCRLARNEYVRQRRLNPSIAASEYTTKRARERALWRLAKRHDVEFRGLVDDEMRSVGA